MNINLVAWVVVANWLDAACCDGCRDVASLCVVRVGGAMHCFGCLTRIVPGVFTEG
ncbi:MAG: hypothetical protein WD875_11265 [Pirellulales bacterium]